MNEPFSEKSARQVIQQSGQFTCPPPDIPVSTQSVYPQNRHTNSQTNYQVNRSLNRPMNYQPHRQEERPPSAGIRSDNPGENRNTRQNMGTEDARIQNIRDENIRTESSGAENLKTENLRAENTRVENIGPVNRAACNPVVSQNIPSGSSSHCRQDNSKNDSVALPPSSEGYTIAYHTATPYPPVKVSGQNPQYAAAMLDNMAGQNSEMSAVGLYFYDQLISAGYKEISDTFHHISIVEMHHMEIFSHLAMQLGENPRLWYRQPRSGRYIYWTPAGLHYPHVQPPSPECMIPKTSLRRILSQAIEAEQAAVKKYMNQTTWIKDNDICDNLRRIAADEQMHVDIFTRLYHTL